MAINETTLQLTETLKKEITIDSAAGTATITPNAYEQIVNEAGLTTEQYNLSRKLDTELLAAGQNAFGEKAIEAMQANTALERLSLTMPMIGKDKMNFVFDKSIQVPVKGEDGAADGTKTKYGATRATIELYGESGSRGQLKQVRDSLAEKALAAFNK